MNEQEKNPREIVYPPLGAVFDCSDPVVQTCLLEWLDSLEERE